MLVGRCFEAHLAGISTVNPQRCGSFLTCWHLTLEIEKVQLGTQDCEVRAVTTVCHWSTVMQWTAIIIRNTVDGLRSQCGMTQSGCGIRVCMVKGQQLKICLVTSNHWNELIKVLTHHHSCTYRVYWSNPPALCTVTIKIHSPLFCGLARNRKERTVLKA